MTKTLRLSNLEALSKVFMFLDVNGDGKIDRGEFCKGIRELIKRNPNLSIDEAALFDSIDEDGSGTIELSEFQQTFKVVDLPYHMAVMMSLDRDKSGTIDRQEFREGVKLLNARLFESEKIPETDSHINALFDKLDLNKNGVLEESEFRKFLQSYYPC